MAEFARMLLAGVAVPVVSLALLVSLPYGLIRLARVAVPARRARFVRGAAAGGLLAAASAPPPPAVLVAVPAAMVEPEPPQAASPACATPQSLVDALHAIGELRLPCPRSTDSAADTAAAVAELVDRVSVRLLNTALAAHGFAMGTRAWADALPSAWLAVGYAAHPDHAERN